MRRRELGVVHLVLGGSYRMSVLLAEAAQSRIDRQLLTGLLLWVQKG